jgi:hypothetical protein
MYMFVLYIRQVRISLKLEWPGGGISLSGRSGPKLGQDSVIVTGGHYSLREIRTDTSRG